MPRGGSARNRRVARRAASRVEGADVALDTTGVDNALTAAQEWGEIADLVAAPPRTRAQITLDALLASGVPITSGEVTTTYDVGQGSLGERTFLSKVIESGYTESRGGSWPCEGELGDHGEVLYRGSNDGVFRLDGGTLVYASIGHGWCYVRVASPDRVQATETVDTFASAYPPLYREQRDEQVVPITFWTNGKYGPSSRLRMIDSASWADIDGNYTAAVKDELGRLMTSFEPGKDGQLLLWQGSPGTGKTWALRALASEWSDWAEFSYITDPDSFFVDDPSYMIDVLLHGSYEELTVDGDVVTEAGQDKWRVLILEDTGELLSANAKEAYGQGLSRLLNVVDGMVGQGLRVLALVTTNDELGDLHPAVTRPGRCASQIEFGPLTAEEASEWINDGDLRVEFDAPKTLAELYALRGLAVEAFAEDPDGPDSEDREPMSGSCSCGHMASQHDGDYNDGECTNGECSCEQFEAAEDDTDMGESAIVADGEVLPVSAALITELYGDTWRLTSTETAVNNVVTPVTNVRMNLGEIVISGPDGARYLVADGALTPLDITPGGVAPATRPDVEIVPAAPADLFKGTVQWEAVLCPEGVPTDDGRIFAPGSIGWRELPLSLMAMIETQEGHDGAQVAGRIDQVWRDTTAGLIRGSGEFDTGDFGSMIARLVDDRTLRGISVDIAVSEMEIVPRADVLDADGNWIEVRDPEVEAEEPSLMDVLFGDPADQLFVVREGIIGAATVCPFQAFREATIEVASSLVASVQAPMVWTATGDGGYRLAVTAQETTGDEQTPDGGDGDVLTASAAGIAPADVPPAEWFADPEFEVLTPLTVTDDGRVYGHAAPWDSCHIGIPGVCTTAPASHSDYAYFHLKEVVLDDGSRVSCGSLTLDTGHAERSLGRAAAARHYDDTGTVVADVIVGEDEHGIWVAGALRGDVSEADARKLRGAALSGDWRTVNGNLELVALLCVNVPGFPVPRTPSALVASGHDGSPMVVTLISTGLTAETVTERMREQFKALADGAAYDEIARQVA